MVICERCIIPSSFPNVTIENGTCTFCKIHDISPRVGRDILGKDVLFDLLNFKKSIKYDCVVGLSGGKDSSYALYYIAREIGLKPLAVFFDNGFISDQAKENIRNICESLRVDLVVHKASKYRIRTIKENLCLSKYTGIFYACFNCENNLRTAVINSANDHGIPYVVYGATDYEDPYTTFLNPEAKTFRIVKGERHSKISDTLKHIKWTFLDPLFLPMKIKDKPCFYYHYLLSKYYMVRDNIRIQAPEGWKNLNPAMNVTFDGKKVKTVYLFDYINYNPEKMVEILKKETNWNAPSGKEARMDCKLGCFANYQHLLNTGITKDGFTLSVLVRNGLLSRAEALRREKIIKKDLKNECERVKKEILNKASEM